MLVPNPPQAPLAAGDPRSYGPGDRRPPPSGDPRSYGPHEHWLPDHRSGSGSSTPTGLPAWQQLPVHHQPASYRSRSIVDDAHGDVFTRRDSYGRRQYGEGSLPSQKRPRFEDSPPKQTWLDDDTCKGWSSRGHVYQDVGVRGSAEGAMTSSHHQHCGPVGDEGGCSPRFDSPLKGSLPLPKQYRREDAHERPSSELSQLEDAHRGLSTRGHMYEDGGVGGGGHHVAEWKVDASYQSLVNDFMDAVENNWHEADYLGDNPTVPGDKYKEQAKRFAELALRRYNKNKGNKVKYSLVEAIHGNFVSEKGTDYIHLNFSVTAKNGPTKSDTGVLVFAELHHVGYRPNAMALTSFHLLDEKNQIAGCYNQSSNSFSEEDKDIHHCYACDSDIKHPCGSRYKAGPDIHAASG
uniref:DUF3615 domain-containing protein n=1 Tax=Leersia perrieri TaxID=77586 RepID=A0A0D9WTT6_9ORYZ